MLLNVLSCTGQAPAAKNDLDQMSAVLKLRTPVLKSEVKGWSQTLPGALAKLAHMGGSPDGLLGKNGGPGHLSYLAKKEAATEVPVEVSLATQEPCEAGTLQAAGLSAL